MPLLCVCSDLAICTVQWKHPFRHYESLCRNNFTIYVDFFFAQILVVLASSAMKMHCIDMPLRLIVVLTLGFRGIGRYELSQSEHLHHLGPWRLWSSRSSAATSSTTPQVAGRRRHQHRPISRRLSPHTATMPATAGPSTPASPSASCHPRPRRGLHGPAPPLSPRHRNSSSFTMGNSAAEQSL